MIKINQIQKTHLFFSNKKTKSKPKNKQLIILEFSSNLKSCFRLNFLNTFEKKNYVKNVNNSTPKNNHVCYR